MSDALYERYKDALRRGHVAALRDRLDAALVAYGEAADIAPERALPHASLAAILVKLGRSDEALAAFGRALDRAPRDETVLVGRADLLATLGRRVEAAADLDSLAEVQEADSRMAVASETALKALQLAESKARRRHVEALVRRLRETPGEEAAAAALDRALSALGPATVEPGRQGAGVAWEDETTEHVAAAAEGHHATDRGASAASIEALAPEPPPDGAALSAEAEDLIDAGDGDAARDRLIVAARAHYAQGRLSAALDACYLALGIAPFDLEVHVLLAELYLEQGWRAPAAEKLLLLGRLVDLAEDQDGRRRICGLVSARMPDDERLAAMCA